MLPELTDDGELPTGVHIANWQEFESRFGGSSPRRLWLSGRLRTILELAATSGQLRRAFVWGSFVTAKPSPGDLDVLLIVGEGPLAAGLHSNGGTGSTRNSTMRAGDSRIPRQGSGTAHSGLAARPLGS